MSRIRQKNTSIENLFAKILNNFGRNYTQHINNLPGTPDFGNIDEKWIIFTHGCFWHAHEECKYWRIPHQNQEYWKEKFKRNRDRDSKKITQLEAMGYEVLILWECELKNDAVYKKITEFFSTPYELFTFSDSKKTVNRTVYDSRGNSFITEESHPEPNNHEISAYNAYDLAFLRRKSSPESTFTNKPVTCVDLFCGCGGLSLGMKEAARALKMPFMSIAAIENNPEILDVYVRNIGCIHPISKDIVELVDGQIGEPATKIEKKLLTKIKPVRILLAGPPCQGYSDLNNHTRRDDPRNALYRRVTRFIELIKPEFVLIENVHTVTHGKNGEVEEAIDVMNNLGYHSDDGIVDRARAPLHTVDPASPFNSITYLLHRGGHAFKHE